MLHLSACFISLSLSLSLFSLQWWSFIQPKAIIWLMYLLVNFCPREHIMKFSLQKAQKETRAGAWIPSWLCTGEEHEHEGHRIQNNRIPPLFNQKQRLQLYHTYLSLKLFVLCANFIYFFQLNFNSPVSESQREQTRAVSGVCGLMMSFIWGTQKYQAHVWKPSKGKNFAPLSLLFAKDSV